MSTYYEPYSILCGDLNGKKIQKKEARYIYIYIYSFCSTVETNITL